MPLGSDAYVLKIDGSELSAEVRDRFLRLEYVEALDRLDVLRIELDVPHHEPDPVIGAMAIGNPFTLELGDSSVAREGDITELSHDWSPDAPWTVTFTGLDRLHRLRDTSHTRVFLEQKHDAIVKSIAGEYGFGVDVQGVSTSATSTFQASETDAVFLKRLARMYNYCLRMKGNDLVFARRNESSGSVSIAHDRIERMSLRASMDGVVKKVTAVGWDPDAQANVTSVKTAAKGISGSETGISLATNFGDKHLVLGSLPATQSSSTEALAESELQSRAERFVQGSLTCSGFPDATPMAELEITGGPSALQGTFIISQVTHTLETGSGYKTHIEFFSDGK